MIEWNDHDDLYEVGKRFHPVWRRAAELMLRGDYYPLTETRADPADWYALQFHDAERGEGLVQIIRNVAVETDRLVLKGFVPPENLGRIYKFTEPLSGQVWTMSGANFASGGFEEGLKPRSGEIWFYCVL
jgi:hypothetical protein